MSTYLDQNFMMKNVDPKIFTTQAVTKVNW